MITPDWVRASVHTAVYTGIVFGGVGVLRALPTGEVLFGMMRLLTMNLM
jgi:hypothetical protein